MGENRGKQFEGVIRQAFETLKDCSVDRLHDQTNGFKGSQNICDFIIYKEPNEIYLECKSCHGGTLPLTNITDNQRLGLLEKSNIKGVIAGVIVWWIDKDVTRFLPIDYIQKLKVEGYKSIHYTTEKGIKVPGRKKRVFFEYDMKSFLDEVQKYARR